MNSLMNVDHKIYCMIDVKDNVAKEQFRQDVYNQIFYESAVTQFVDHNNEETVNAAITA